MKINGILSSGWFILGVLLIMPGEILAQGNVQGNIYDRLCPPWGAERPCGSVGLRKAVQAKSVDGTITTTMIECCPRTPDCFKVRFDSIGAIVIYKYEFRNLLPGRYTIAYVLADSASIASGGVSGSTTYLSFARSSGTYAPDQADSSRARILTINGRSRRHRNVDIFHAEP